MAWAARLSVLARDTALGGLLGSRDDGMDRWEGVERCFVMIVGEGGRWWVGEGEMD